MEEQERRLLRLLLHKSFKYRTDPPFTLASGKKHPCYIDCKPATHNAEGLALIGELVFARIRDLEVRAVGGLTMGADPIAHATALTSYQRGRPVNAFCVRKAGKDHGIVKDHGVEGDVRPGDRVVVLEDVITTGGSTIRAIQAARAFGLEVVKVVALVDREDEGLRNIGQYVPVAEALFTLGDFLREKGIRLGAQDPPAAGPDSPKADA